jgi:hypothetical protein
MIVLVSFMAFMHTSLGHGILLVEANPCITTNNTLLKYMNNVSLINMIAQKDVVASTSLAFPT